ncbi:MAG: hypothetical protein V4489_08580 [Chlamydiota bacterium]
MKKIFIKLFFILAASGRITAEDIPINTVDHKNTNLVKYLDLIKYNIKEKTEILPYILEKPDGIFLEIGTGGDPITNLFTQIPSNNPSTIIASDVDNNVLELLIQRHPELQPYLSNNSFGPKLVLKQLNAIDMQCFDNDYLSGINASSVVHEIVSYAGGIDAFQAFFKESFRVLKPDGVLIYRDPEAVLLKNKIIKANFKNKSIKLFTHIFLTKFLDNSYCNLAKSNKKFTQYNTNEITFYLYKQYSKELCTLTYDEYLKTQSYDIDFSRQYTVKLPLGLVREIERHYLIYLKECNPLAFIKCMPKINTDMFFVNYLSNNARKAFQDFLTKHQIECKDGLINAEAKDVLNATIDDVVKPIEFGLKILIPSQLKKQKLINLLKKEGFEPGFYIKLIKKDTYLLDYRLFSLFYDFISESILDDTNKLLTKEDSVHAIYLKSEGDETYCYYSDDELISKVAIATIGENELSADLMVLCPVSSEHNKFIPRICYQKILSDVVEVTDNAGYSIKNKEGKRIIHFRKMKLSEAVKIYKTIINSDPDRYVNLQALVNNLHIEQESILAAKK